MTAADHVSQLLASCSRQMCALKVLRAHGIAQHCTHSVVSWLTYCVPVWTRFCSAADIVRLNVVLRQCRRFNYLDSMGVATVEELYKEADEKLFNKMQYYVTLPCNPCSQSFRKHLQSAYPLS